MNLKKNLARAMTAVMALGTLATFAPAAYAASATATDTMSSNTTTNINVTHAINVLLGAGWATEAGSFTITYPSDFTLPATTGAPVTGCTGAVQPTMNIIGNVIEVLPPATTTIVSCVSGNTLALPVLTLNNPSAAGTWVVPMAGAFTGSYTVTVAPNTDVIQVKDVMTRMQVSAASVGHVISAILPGNWLTSAGTLVLTYPAGFDFGTSAVAVTGCTSGTPTQPTMVLNHNVITLSVSDASCVATDVLHLATLTSTNPGTTGVKMIEVTGAFTGAYAVDILTSDTINVTATVDPSITFDVGATPTACSGSFVSDNWSVDLGHLNGSRKIASSDDAQLTKHICTKLSTNATHGAVVTAKNAHGADGLKSASKPEDMIPSTVASVTDTVPTYGMCFANGSGKYGYSLISTPAGNPPATAAGANGGVSSFAPVGDCTASVVTGAEKVGLFTGANNAADTLTVWHVEGVTDSAFATLMLKVGISATQPAHNDYGDSITFVATATF